MTPEHAARERELLGRWQTLRDQDDPERCAVRDELITMHLPLVRHLALRYANRGEPLDDVMQVGTIGLMKAIDRFELDRGAAFSSFATPTIVGEIRRHFRDHTWSLHVPRPVKERGAEVMKASEELTRERGLPPTAQDIAQRLGIDVGAVVEAMDASHAYRPVPLEAPSGSMVVEPVMDDDVFAAVDDHESLLPLLRKLDDREQEILRMRFAENMSQSLIAKELGISQMHVSRLLGRSLQTLRAGLQDPGDSG